MIYTWAYVYTSTSIVQQQMSSDIFPKLRSSRKQRLKQILNNSEQGQTIQPVIRFIPIPQTHWAGLAAVRQLN